MQPEDMSGGTPQEFRKVERVLIIRPVADSLMAETTLLEGGGNDIGLGDYIEEHYRED